MELALTAGLAGLGYSLINKNKNPRPTLRQETPLSENNIPNNENRVESVAERLSTRSATRWEDSKNPNETNIIPANFNKDFQDLSNLTANDPNMDLYSNGYNTAVKSYDELNRNEMQDSNSGFLKEYFAVNNHNPDFIPDLNNPQTIGHGEHNNMTPFFGGTIKQNTRIDQHQTTLDLFTGTERLKGPKEEVEYMFKPEKNVGNMEGMTYNDDKTRFVKSIYRQGEKPFQEIKVGPGLNDREGISGDIGFHDTYRPPVKTVDELRIKKKETFEGRIKPPKAVVTNRGKMGKLFKNLPEKFYEKTIGHLFKTTGATVKERQREKYILKDQNRKKSRAVQGVLGPATEEKHETRPIVQKDKNNTLKATGMRHLGAGDKWKAKKVGEHGLDHSDYGKKSYANKPNERQITGTRTVTSNLRGREKETRRLLDKAKSTKKELYTTYSRRGNARLKGVREHTVPHSQALRTTIKETLIHDNRKGNVQVEKKNVVIDKKNWRMKTTHREVNKNKYGDIDPQPMLKGPNKGKAYDPSSTPKTTVKETTIDNDHKGHMAGKGGITKHVAFDMKDTAKTTVKETTIDSDYKGVTNSQTLQRGMGYVTANKSATAPNTNRQYTSDVEYFGTAEDEQGNGYLTAPAEAPNTNRQYTSDFEYKGAGNSYRKAQMSYHDKYNAKLNALKEIISKGRAPTQESVKLMNGSDKVNLEPRKKVSIEEKVHQAGLSRIYEKSASETASNCQMTKIPNTNDADVLSERIDMPDLLKPFKENPYTQPLDSY